MEPRQVLSPDWIILRCAGRATLRVAGSLAEDGFGVWTPVETVMAEVPRVNVKRKVIVPMLAGFVFARAEHLVDLLELASMPVKPRRGAGLLKPAHASFSVFHYFDRIPAIADCDLNPLRRIARRRSAAPRARLPLKKYQRVTVEDEGAWHGKTGVVQESNERETVVCFNGKWDVTISTFILKPIGLDEGSADTGTAARKAA